MYNVYRLPTVGILNNPLNYYNIKPRPHQEKLVGNIYFRHCRQQIFMLPTAYERKSETLSTTMSKTCVSDKYFFGLDAT